MKKLKTLIGLPVVVMAILCAKYPNKIDALGRFIDAEFQGNVELKRIANSMSMKELLNCCINNTEDNNIDRTESVDINKFLETVGFQVVFSSEEEKQECLEFLTNNESSPVKPKTLVSSLLTDFSKSMFKNITKPSACITSPGSKVIFSRMFNWAELDPFPRVIVEPFCRTAAVSLSIMNDPRIEKVVLNDADIRVVNYLYCLKNCPIYLMHAIIEEIKSKDYNDWLSGTLTSDKYFNRLNKGILKLKKCGNILDGKSSLCKHNIIAAAYFFLTINLTSNGASKKLNKKLGNTLKKVDSLTKKFVRMMAASYALRKAVILHKDFEEIINEYGNETNKYATIIFCDSPYLFCLIKYSDKVSIVTDKSVTKVSYVKEFREDDLKRMNIALHNANSRVLITHSDNEKANQILGGNIEAPSIKFITSYESYKPRFKKSEEPNPDNQSSKKKKSKMYKTNVFGKNVPFSLLLPRK